MHVCLCFYLEIIYFHSHISVFFLFEFAFFFFWKMPCVAGYCSHVRAVAAASSVVEILEYRFLCHSERKCGSSVVQSDSSYSSCFIATPKVCLLHLSGSVSSIPLCGCVCDCVRCWVICWAASFPGTDNDLHKPQTPRIHPDKKL